MKWFKYGCFGCLGVLALLLVAGAVIWGLAYQKTASMDVQEQILTHPLEEAPAVTAEALAADMPAGAGEAMEASRPVPGRVTLNLSQADFRVEPAGPGEPLRVEGTFDRNSYTLEESFEAADDGGWDYQVRFSRSEGAGLLTTLSEMISGARPKLAIYLPPGHPMALKADVKQGGLTAELGGLWITEADLDFAMGGFDFRVSEPLREPMERMVIRGQMGGGSFAQLGNASPRSLEVEFKMGGLSLDLHGAWKQDARIAIEQSMGGAHVGLPSGVNFEGLPPEAGTRPQAGPDAPTLTFEVSGSSGDLKFD